MGFKIAEWENAGDVAPRHQVIKILKFSYCNTKFLQIFELDYQNFVKNFTRKSKVILACAISPLFMPIRQAQSDLYETTTPKSTTTQVFSWFFSLLFTQISLTSLGISDVDTV